MATTSGSTDLRAVRKIEVFGPPECPKCRQTIDMFARAGIRAHKIDIESRDHFAVIAAKTAAGRDLVSMPSVYIDNQYAWHDFHRFEIMKTVKAELELLEAEASVH